MCKQGNCKYGKYIAKDNVVMCKHTGDCCVSVKKCVETGKCVISELARQYCKFYSERQ